MVVDDHAVVREGLIALIDRQSDLEVVGEAKNGREAIDLYFRLEPDLVLMDLHLPELDGVQATETICAADPGAKVLALTTYSRDEYIHLALQAGARGYLLKTVSRDELLAALRTVARGGRVIPDEIGSKLARRMTQESLTPRELAVLACMVDGESNKMIAHHLGITTGTVKCYVHNILAKLAVPDRTSAVVKAIDQGLVARQNE